MARTDAEKLSAFLSLVRDVQQLHSCGYTHTDIKENNVVVRRDADDRLQVSLIDYGLAKIIGTSHQCVGGDPTRTPWMAPELYHGAPCEPSSDVYSLGFVLQNLLAKCKRRYPSLRALASTALSPDPADRPSVAMMAQTMQEQADYQQQQHTGHLGKTPKRTSILHRFCKVFSRCFPRVRK